ncbi:hypothetical protein ENSA5_03110 [Enhygromyxa salina]|uniref:STAS domain-containing protein n=1 Tax=Enhygromyxa salina TaxID=215803 RepID=A0A2S9YJR5_9BACT|nr:hypothetical protein [Enhygromyxa salina]PRQ05321.1 hypothetical protein ENSA5_03110 [Enhygromyxa salina]
MSSQADLDVQIDLTGAVIVKLSGRANDRRPAAALNPVFEGLVEMGRYLRFDFSELEHISSSTMVVVLKFFKQLIAMGVGFDLRYDKSVAWQRMTFAPATAMMAPSSLQLAA